MFWKLQHRTVAAVLVLILGATTSTARPDWSPEQAVTSIIATSQVPSNRSSLTTTLTTKVVRTITIKPYQRTGSTFAQYEFESNTPTSGSLIRSFMRNTPSSLELTNISNHGAKKGPTRTAGGTTHVQSIVPTESQSLSKFVYRYSSYDAKHSLRVVWTTVTVDPRKGSQPDYALIGDYDRDVDLPDASTTGTAWHSHIFGPEGTKNPNAVPRIVMTGGLGHAPTRTASGKSSRVRCTNADDYCNRIKETAYIGDADSSKHRGGANHVPTITVDFAAPGPIMQTCAPDQPDCGLRHVAGDPVASPSAGSKKPSQDAFICPFNEPQCHLDTSSTTLDRDAPPDASPQAPVVDVQPPAETDRKMPATDSNGPPAAESGISVVKERISTARTSDRENTAVSSDHPSATLRPTANDNVRSSPQHLSSRPSSMVGEIIVPPGTASPIPSDRDSLARQPSSDRRFQRPSPLTEEPKLTGVVSWSDELGGSPSTSGERKGQASQTISTAVSASERQASQTARDPDTISEDRTGQASQSVSKAYSASERQASHTAPGPDSANNQQASPPSFITTSAHTQQASYTSSSPNSADERSASLTSPNPDSATMRQVIRTSTSSALTEAHQATTAASSGQAVGVGGHYHGNAGLVVALAGLLAVV
ncbi:hypothetical protein CP533_0459 [Ophiocordyceps camponoti-saundersi (nom. inval.)]|nr:hypothetical protein CP533_0459 [Ophiocordyceps camponoti-saundersi (nom. inval.)]